MRDRYYGNNDPVADKLLNRAKAMPVLQPPEDGSITTLYVGDLGPAGVINEADLRLHCLFCFFFLVFVNRYC